MISEREKKRLLRLNGKKIPDNILATMTTDALGRYRELKTKANVSIFQLIPLLGVLVLLYSVFVNFQFSKTLGMAGVSGIAISMIIVLMDGMKSYSSYQIGVCILENKPINKLHVFSAFIFGFVAVYAFYIVNIGAGNQAASTSSNFESDVTAYNARVANLERGIASGEANKPDKDAIKRTENELDNVSHKMGNILERVTWKRGKKILIGSMLGTPVCAKINGAYTRQYCPPYNSLKERKAVLEAKMARFMAYKEPDMLRAELSTILSSPPKKPTEAVKLSFTTVLVLGFLVEFLGMLLILEQQKALRGFHQSMLFVDRLRKYNKAQISSYIEKNTDTESPTLAGASSSDVVIHRDAKIIRKYLLQSTFYKDLVVSKNGRLQSDHLKALLEHKTIGKKFSKKPELERVADLLAYLRLIGVTTSGNRGRKMTATFRNSLKKG